MNDIVVKMSLLSRLFIQANTDYQFSVNRTCGDTLLCLFYYLKKGNELLAHIKHQRTRTLLWVSDCMYMCIWNGHTNFGEAVLYICHFLVIPR
jgi:hypothetical protein